MANQQDNQKQQDIRPDDSELAERLDALKSELNDHKHLNSPSSSEGDKAGVGLAMRLSSEFIAGVVVGGAIGYGIDSIAGTSPWGLIVFLLLGFVAAVVNVMRSAGMMSESGMRLSNAREMAEKSTDSDDLNANR